MTSPFPFVPGSQLERLRRQRLCIERVHSGGYYSKLRKAWVVCGKLRRVIERIWNTKRKIFHNHNTDRADNRALKAEIMGDETHEENGEAGDTAKAQAKQYTN